jgi:hypothetical protein
MKVSLVCIAKNEDNYIKEWIDYHLKIGFDDIHIYMNDWRIELEKENVYTYELDGSGAQLKAYNNFINSKSEQNQWVAFFDVDEFLVLKKHLNVKDFLRDYSDLPAIGINWVFFGDNGLSSVQDGEYSLINRFTKRGTKVDRHIKTILKINDGVIMPHVHHPNIRLYDTNRRQFSGPFNNFGDDNIAQLNHYFCKTYEEYVEKVSRGRADIKNGKRNLNEFHPCNLNEVEDLTLYNLINNHDNHNIFNT